MGSATPHNRRDRRKMAKQLGAKNVIAHTITIDGAAISEAVSQGANTVDLVMHFVDEAMRVVIDEGGDVLEHAVVTIGRHPDHPDDLTVQVKTDKRIKAPDA